MLSRDYPRFYPQAAPGPAGWEQEAIRINTYSYDAMPRRLGPTTEHNDTCSSGSAVAYG